MPQMWRGPGASFDGARAAVQGGRLVRQRLCFEGQLRSRGAERSLEDGREQAGFERQPGKGQPSAVGSRQLRERTQELTAIPERRAAAIHAPVRAYSVAGGTRRPRRP